MPRLLSRAARHCAVLCLTSPAGLAQEPDSTGDPPIDTDRPGNGNAATTVPRGRLQVELGANYALERLTSDPAPETGSTIHGLTFPLALRLGVTEILELRAGTGVVGIGIADGEDVSIASTDTAVGAKLALLANDGWVPSLALMTDVFLPSGSGAFTQGVVVPEARGAAFWGLPADFGLLLNVGGDVPADSGDHFLRGLYVAHVNYAPSALAGNLVLFVESFGRVPLASEPDAIVQLDMGVAWRLGHDWQLDAFTQHGLTEAAPDFQASLGASARF